MLEFTALPRRRRHSVHCDEAGFGKDAVRTIMRPQRTRVGDPRSYNPEKVASFGTPANAGQHRRTGGETPAD
jgi:hypothetical protein